jgi:hypothetical protein
MITCAPIRTFPVHGVEFLDKGLASRYFGFQLGIELLLSFSRALFGVGSQLFQATHG